MHLISPEDGLQLRRKGGIGSSILVRIAGFRIQGQNIVEKGPSCFVVQDSFERMVHVTKRTLDILMPHTGSQGLCLTKLIEECGFKFT